jgi:hypothetical protein
MSAIKKQSKLRWSHQNELSDGGAVIATMWTATVGRYRLTVTNYPGTKTLEWEISIPGTNWRSGADVDRYEFTVSTLKDYVFNKAQGLNAL